MISLQLWRTTRSARSHSRTSLLATNDFNEVGEKILIDHPATVDALERAYYKLYNSVLSCVCITLTTKEARAFPRNYDVNADTVCVLAAVHCEDGCYGYTIGKCDVDCLDDKALEHEAGKLAISLALELAVNDQTSF